MEAEKYLRWVKCPDCGYERYIRKESKATGICRQCLPARMKKARTITEDRLWYIRKDGTRETGVIIKCVDCARERIDAKSRKTFSKRCEQCRRKLRGEKHGNYIDGRSARTSKTLRELREKVLERDGYKCKNCGTDKNLHMHHIIPWRADPLKRTDIDNCITYCSSCHITIENTGKKATPETRERLRISHLGKKPTEEQKKKQSESLKKHWKSLRLL